MKTLRFRHWPEQDKLRFLAFKSDSQNPFHKLGTRTLSPHTISSFEEAHSRLLGFVNFRHPALLELEPHERLTRSFVREFTDWLRPDCRATTISSIICRLYYLQRWLSPEVNFSWLRRIANHIRREAQRIRHPLVFSSELRAAGLDGMALAKQRKIPKHRRWRIAYRDALIVAALAEAPMRIGSFCSLQLQHFECVGSNYIVSVPAHLTKTKTYAEYELSSEVSEGIDVYLATVRPGLERSIRSDAFWLSYDGAPITRSGLQQMLPKYTLNHLGVSVSAHGFRRAAGALIAYQDPKNIMAVRDLLGHADFRMTEQHYLPAAQTIRAGRELEAALSLFGGVRT